MAKPLSKPDFLADLRARIGRHCETVTATFQPLDETQLLWRPDPREWNVLQCFDHLNLTHDYYMPRMDAALRSPEAAGRGQDVYRPSFWGRIYMFFSFNPRFSFPTAAEITPGTELSRDVLQVYLAKQAALLQVLDRVNDVDLRRTRIPIDKGIRFNLGDCLKILVYHDRLHIGQARGVLAAQGSARTGIKG
jgi:hypothetical protein